MKVILKKDVEKLGGIGDVKEVADGYARNFLFPQQLAMPATKGAVKEAEQLKRAAEKRRQKQRTEAQELAGSMSQLNLAFKRRVGENDRLYGSVTSSDIAEAVEAAGFEVDRRKIELDEPLKEVGSHSIAIKLLGDVVAHVTVTIEPLEEEKE
ncbi:MAG: 50S ribosomal protein L9 [Chloroflexi bacterium]|nr:50S ribosomal protein L9 [Chloroflexota bacterium]